MHLHDTVPHLPIQRVLPTVDGKLMIRHENCTIRLLTYLEGTPLKDVPLTRQIRQMLGNTLATLDLALKDFNHKAASRMLPWDLKLANNLHPLLQFVEYKEDRKLIEYFHDQFNNQVVTLMPELRCEMFFPKGAVHEAYIEVRGILEQAREEIRIIDPYIDGSLLSMLTILKQPMRVSILTGHRLPGDFGMELDKFLEQYKSFEIAIRQASDFHDRFLVVDRRDYYHLGASIKDAGKKAFMVSRVEDESNISALAEALKITWEKSEKFKRK